MASTYLTRSISSGSDLTKWTWSCWVKRTDLVGGGNNYQRLISNEHSGDNNKAWYIRFQNSTQFHGWSENGAFEFTTNAKYRDVNGWYHLVVKYDSTQSTQSDRVKVYVNGEEPSMSAITYPSLNQVCNFMNSDVGYVDIGYYRQGGGEYFHGLMSHMHFTAGYAYDASTFGQADANGVWKIIAEPSVTYGSLGFFILKDGNSVTDQSGEGNNFTVGGGTLTNTEDSPSNVFATFNPLAGYYNGSTFSNGNNTVVTGTTQYSYDRATLGASSGKYYWEIQYAGRSGGSIPYSLIGISSTQPKSTTDFLGKYSYDWAYYVTSSSKIMNASTETSYGTTYGDNDIIGVAMDLDNYKLYFSKNGTWQNSGDPTSGSTGTGAISIVNPSTASYGIDTPLGAYFPAVSFYDGGVSGTYKANFGNGYFGTTAVSSAGTNASGIGIFEYDVPTGYTALSTKGLNL